MAQTFTLDRHTDPLNPTAVPANNEKIKNYETIADMESDLTNVDDGEVRSSVRPFLDFKPRNARDAKKMLLKLNTKYTTV